MAELKLLPVSENGQNYTVDFVKNLHVYVCSRFFPYWFEFSWDYSGVNMLGRKKPAPHSFDIAKGSTHMAVTREFVKFTVNDSRAQDLLDWMKDIKVPDEHFFQTLNHNPQMDIPGAFLGQFSN